MKVQIVSKFLNRLQIRVLLYTIVVLVTMNAIVMLYSTKATKEAIEQSRVADRLLFTAKLPHDFSIRDADIALRGYALTRDQKFLFATIPRIRIEMENSFTRVDSILAQQGFSSAEGKAKIDQYKREMRAFNDHQNELVKLVQQGKMDLFMSEFQSDAGSNLWPAFVDATEVINNFELSVLEGYQSRARFSSLLAFWLQVITFLLSTPLLFYIIVRLAREREQGKTAEEFRVKTELNNLKEKMLSVLSHEIRTPLNSIIGLSRVLATKSMKPEQTEIVTTIRRSSDHLLHLVNDILDFNKISVDKLVLESVAFNVREIVKQVVNMYHGIAKEKGIDLTYNLGEAIPATIVGDPTRLTQVLSNLVSNSIKFSNGGVIKLDVTSSPYAEGSQFRMFFDVIDSGVGIAQDRIATIFEPFSQGRPVSRNSEGTGLGLSIVKSLVELMGGTISVKSVVGVGSTFTVDLPALVPDTMPDTSNEVTEDPDIAGTEILYVEDVASNRYLVETLLGDKGVACTNAASGKEALHIIFQKRFDLILLDIKLPDIDGLELLAIIKNDQKSLNRKTPVIIFSAYTELNGYRIKSVGADDFLCKPFDPQALVGKIHRYTSRELH